MSDQSQAAMPSSMPAAMPPVTIPPVTMPAAAPAHPSQSGPAVSERAPKEGPMKRLYHWTMALAEKPYAIWALGFVAFAESSFFPFPPDIILIPMSIAKPRSAWLYALVCTVCSVTGAMLGYAVGALLYDTVGLWLIHLYGYGPQIAVIKEKFDHYGWAFILFKGVTPIPFKLVTITSGLFGYNFPLFVLMCTITRGLRFVVTALLLNRFGPTIKGLLERYFGLFMLLTFVLLIVGIYIAAKIM